MPEKYPDVPGAVVGCDTSEAAGVSMVLSAPTLRAKIHDLVTKNPCGLTCDEIEQVLNLRHQTASARIRELVMGGLLEDSGLRRTTRSGRAARVYCVVP